MNVFNQAKFFDIGYLDHKRGIFKLIANHLGGIVRVGYHLVGVVGC